MAVQVIIIKLPARPAAPAPALPGSRHGYWGLPQNAETRLTGSDHSCDKGDKAIKYGSADDWLPYRLNREVCWALGDEQLLRARLAAIQVPQIWLSMRSEYLAVIARDSVGRVEIDYGKPSNVICGWRS